MSLATLARNTGYAFGENRLTLAAAIILALLALCALFGPSIAPFDPLTTNAAAKLARPSALHPFGTDALGRDILSRVIVAARLDLGMALSAVVLSFVAMTRWEPPELRARMTRLPAPSMATPEA